MSLLDTTDNQGTGSKVIQFLYSTGNIVGCCFAIVGMMLYFFGIIESYWHLIVTGMYLVGYFIVPGIKDSAELKADRFNEDNILEALEVTLKKIGPKLPEQARTHLAAITKTMASLVPALQSEETDYQVDVRSRATIMATVTRYLPQTLAAYLRLPPAFAAMHSGPEGKTAQALLIEQMRTLDLQLQQIAQNVYNHDVERLIVNGRFLEEKFHL